MNQSYIISHARIVCPQDIRENHCIEVKNGMITRIEQDLPEESGFKVIDAEGRFILPAPVELHIHGCGPYGFESGEEDVLEKASAFLEKRGVLRFVPALQCDEKAIERLAVERDSKSFLKKRIPGFYIEGPFINPEYKGGILNRNIRKPDGNYLKHLLDLSRQQIRLMTVAPEIEGCRSVIDALLENNVIPCFGHSAAAPSDIPEGLDLSGMNITHLFNAMTGISHKYPGLAMLPFLNDDIFFELNGDGVHCHPDILNLCLNHLNPEHFILITDAVTSAGLPFGEYRYYDKKTISGADGIRYADTRTLVGSNKLIWDVIRQMHLMTSAPLYDLVRFCSLNPARLLGLDAETGSIEPGKQAELIIVDEDLQKIKYPGY